MILPWNFTAFLMHSFSKFSNFKLKKFRKMLYFLRTIQILKSSTIMALNFKNDTPEKFIVFLVQFFHTKKLEESNSLLNIWKLLIIIENIGLQDFTLRLRYSIRMLIEPSACIGEWKNEIHF